MALKIFDKKFGKDFLDSVPAQPGVYRFLDAHQKVVYVGKAKNLKKRLGQYRAARYIKAHRKMKKVVKASQRIEFEVTNSEVDALLLENEIIQTVRPRLNVAGAFSFLYPSIGVRRESRYLHLAYSTHPEAMQVNEFRMFGSYRSRHIARPAFEALVQVMGWLGHRETSSERMKYTAWRRFRQVPRELDSHLFAFLSGQSPDFLEQVILALLERPDARKDAARVQASIADLKTFYDLECVKLARLLEACGTDYVAQVDRDPALIRAGFCAEAEADP